MSIWPRQHCLRITCNISHRRSNIKYRIVAHQRLHAHTGQITIYLSTDISSRSSPAHVRCCAGGDLRTADPTLEIWAKLYRARCTANTRQDELDHTDHTDHTDVEYIPPEISRSSSRGSDISDLSELCGSSLKPLVGKGHHGTAFRLSGQDKIDKGRRK